MLYEFLSRLNVIDGQFYINSLRLLSTTQLLKTVSKSNLLNQFTVEGNNFFFSHFRQAAAVASRKTARKVDNAEGNY